MKLDRSKVTPPLLPTANGENEDSCDKDFWLRPPWTEEEVAPSMTKESEPLPPPMTATSRTPLLPFPFQQPTVIIKILVSIFL